MNYDNRRRRWLKARLRELDKTPAGLARRLDILAPDVYRWINGDADIPAEHLPEIARHLDWPLATLRQHEGWMQ